MYGCTKYCAYSAEKIDEETEKKQTQAKKERNETQKLIDRPGPFADYIDQRNQASAVLESHIMSGISHDKTWLKVGRYGSRRKDRFDKGGGDLNLVD
jgi:hypothetical protein